MRNIFIFALSLLLFGCFSSQPSDTKEVKDVKTVKAEKDKFVGSYATESYKKRDQGSDWVKIDITKGDDDIYTIKADSKKSTKKPTCQITTKAKLATQDTLEDLSQDKPDGYKGIKIFFKISDKGLEIYTKEFKDRFLLMQYCSGGGSLAGTYYKL